VNAFVIDRDEPVGGGQPADVADPAPASQVLVQIHAAGRRCPFSLGGTLAAISEPEARA
jgi:hypothetical protein